MHFLSNNEYDSLQIWLKELKEFQLDSMFDTNVLGRAYLYTNSIFLYENEINCVRGTAGEDGKYETIVISENNIIKGDCSCPFDGNCKHLAATLLVLIPSAESSIKSL